MNIQYEILYPDGKGEKGVLQSDSLASAKAALKSKGAIVLSLDEAAEKKHASLFRGPPRMSMSAKCLFTRQMAGLVDAGLPLDKALLSLTRQMASSRDTTTKKKVEALYDDVREGASLSKAMERYPMDFDSSYRSVIAAAEHSGAMGKVLEQLAQELEDATALKSKLAGAALYPSIVCVFAVIMILFLMTYVVPQVANVFNKGDRALPTLTAIMLTFSTVIRTYWWLLAGLGVAAITTLSWLYRQETSGRAMDAWLLRVPLVGGLMASYNAARFSSTLALLTGSGVPILKALDTAVATMSNRSLRYALNTNLHKVKEGASIAGALDASQALPDAVVTFTRLGEQTGRLPDMLGRVSRQLSTDVTRKAMSLASILEPLLIVGMGLVVMLIVLSVLLPIMDLNKMVR